MFNKTENSKSPTKKTEKKSTFFQESNFKTLNYFFLTLIFFLIQPLTGSAEDLKMLSKKNGLLAQVSVKKTSDKMFSVLGIMEIKVPPGAAAMKLVSIKAFLIKQKKKNLKMKKLLRK